MPNITMLDIEDLKKTKLAPFVNKCLKHRAPDPAFHAMQGHNEDLSKAMYIAWGAIFSAPVNLSLSRQLSIPSSIISSVRPSRFAEADRTLPQ